MQQLLISNSPSIPSHSPKGNFDKLDTTILGWTPDGAIIEEMTGCDGHMHATHISKVWRNENDQVHYVEEITEYLTGTCDKSCHDGQKAMDGSGFLMEY